MFKNNFKKNTIVHWIVLAVLLLCLSGVLFISLRKNSQAFYFQDETDHVAMGWMMNTFNKNLYSDLSTNHQPLPVLFGAFLAKYISYATLFDLIERLRISMFLYAFLWGVLVTVRFKWRGLFSYALTYSVGYYFFSWHVLGESIAAPAALYLVLATFDTTFYPTLKNIWQQRLDGIFTGISLVTVTTSLLPLWPFCLLAFGLLFFKASFLERKYLLFTSLLAGLLFLFFVSPIDWYRESVNNNLLYHIPYEANLTAAEWLKISTFPFLSFMTPMDRLSQMFALPVAISVLLFAIALFKSKKISKQNIFYGTYLYILLVLLNPRVLVFPVAFYQGFHLLPFIAGLFALVVSLIWKSGALIWPKKGSLIACALCIVFFLFNNQLIFRQTDKLNEYYVQYGTQDSFARLLQVFKANDETFFSGPNGHGYINMVSGLPIAGRQLFHLPWSYRSDELREEFHELFRSNPPEYIYFTDDESGYHRDLQPILKASYTEVLHDNKRTFLFFKNEKVESLTESQKKYMEEKDFSFTQG